MTVTGRAVIDEHEPGAHRPAGRAATRRRSALSRALVGAIRGYQVARSGRPTGCRFTPSCSTYALDAVEGYGALAGSGLALRRLLRCRPWGGYGFDPVPERSRP